MDPIDRLEAASAPPPKTLMGNATVTNAAATAFSDGRKAITCNWQGTSITCAYDASYTPAVNDVVTFLKAGSSFYVIGKPAR